MKTNINKVMKAYFGLTGLGESSKVSSAKPVKKFNAERYHAAMTVLAKDEIRAQAEAAVLRARFLEASMARGEAGAKEVLKTVKNAGTDLWRKIKELIKALLIVISEFFADLTSKAKPLEKAMVKWEGLGNRVSTLRKRLAYKAGSIEIDDSYVLEIPKLVADEVYKDPSTLAKVDDFMDVTLADVDNSLQTNDVAAATLKAALYWLNFMKPSKSNKTMKSNFKALKSAAKSTIKTGNVATNISMTHNNATVQTELTNGIDKGREVEVQLADLKGAEKKLLRLKNNMPFETLNMSTQADENKTAFSTTDKLSLLMKIVNIWYKHMGVILTTYKNATHLIKEIKLYFNKLANAPTKITGSVKKEELQVLRKYISRASQGLNISRRLAAVAISEELLYTTETYASIDKFIESAITDDFEENDDVIRGTGRYKR